MRKGNKSKLLIVVLALALALNALALSGAANGGFEVVLDFNEVPGDGEILVQDELPEIEEQPEIEELPAVEPEDEAVVLESETESGNAVLSESEPGQTITPGGIFMYNGTLYRIDREAENIVAGGGSFDTAPSVLTSDDSSTRIDNFINTTGSASHNTQEGHDAPGCLTWNSGVLIWRHNFEADKLYVYSIWYKFDGTADLNDGNRQLEGANDVAGGTHSNPLSNERDGVWRQDWCVFRGNSSVDGRFLYANLVGSGNIYIDDFYIYEVEEYGEGLSIDAHTLESLDSGETFSVPTERIPSSGEYYHTFSYTNANVEEYPVTGVVALMKDGKLEKIFASSTRTVRGRIEEGNIVPSSGTIDVRFEIPELAEDEDISQYYYIAYVVDEGNPFAIIGSPSETNAALVFGEGAIIVDDAESAI